MLILTDFLMQVLMIAILHCLNTPEPHCLPRVAVPNLYTGDPWTTRLLRICVLLCLQLLLEWEQSQPQFPDVNLKRMKQTNLACHANQKT